MERAPHRRPRHQAHRPRTHVWGVAILCAVAVLFARGDFVRDAVAESVMPIAADFPAPVGLDYVASVGLDYAVPVAPDGPSDTRGSAEPVAPDGQDKSRDSAVPAGFETLVEPQTNVVDIFYNGRPIATDFATFTPDAITFDDPEGIVAFLEDVEDEDRAMVVAALTGPLATNARMICHNGESPGDNGCGMLQPNIAGVVFNRSAFRADLFVAGAYRGLQGSGDARYLQPSDSDPAIISYLTGVASGGNQQSNDFNVLNHTVLGMEDNRVVSDLIYDNMDGLFLDQGQFIADREAWRYQGGLFRTAPFEAVAQEKMVGVGIGTQLDSRMDLDLVTGTPLIIFLPVRSKVDILGNGRLLSSQTYDAGNQVLNTAGLPPGSYEVTLRIQEIGGGTREETRFFAKTLELPPADAPTYVLQIGQLVNDDMQGSDGELIGTVTSTPLYRAGTMHRFEEQYGWFADLMGSDTQILTQAGGVHIDGTTRVQGGLIATTDRDYGYFLRYTERFDDFGINLSMRQIFVSETEPSRDNDVFDPFINRSQQFNAAVGYSLPDYPASVSMVGSYSVEGPNKSWSFGPQFSAQVYADNGLNVQWTGSATQSDREFLALTQLRFTYASDNWTYQANLGYRHANPRPIATSDGGSGPEGNVLVTWEDEDILEDDLAFQAGAVSNVNEDSVFVGADYANNIGHVGFDYETTFNSGDMSTTYSGLFDINLIGNADGVAFGGPSFTESGVLVKLDGNISPDQVFVVKVDGDSRGMINPGGSLFVPLAPYETYDVTLTDAEEGFIHLDHDSQQLTLFPGNAVSVEFSADRLIAVFGQVVDDNGEPVANARLEGVIGFASTDEYGYFQSEVTTARRLLVMPRGSEPCTVDLPDELADELYIDLGILTCYPADPDVVIAMTEDDES